MSDYVSYTDFKKLDIRVGQIINVEDHPNADKLYVLTVDFGPVIGKRTIVAGLKNYLKKEELLNQKIIAIINLEPKKLRGIESQGMLLVAQDEDKISLIGPKSDIPNGAKIL